jgi:hypothetical protein
VTAEALAARQNLLDSIRACIQTYTQERAFFDLANLERVRQELHARVSAECARARLAGEVVSCEVLASMPEPELLAQLAARAGLREAVENEARSRLYTDAELGGVVEFCLRTLAQAELLEAETDRAKAEAERARVDAQKQIAVARAEVKIVELDQENRIASRQAELQVEESLRHQAAQERNAGIKERGAAYEFAYKSRRLEEEMALARAELEVAKERDGEEEALRERRRLDMQLELERERELARIRAEEQARVLAELAAAVEKVAAIPIPDYRGVHTLVTSAGTEPRDAASGLVLGLLGRVVEGLGVVAGREQP